MAPEDVNQEFIVQRESGSVDELMHQAGLDAVIWPMGIILGAMLVAYRVGRYFHIVRGANNA